MLRYWTAGESHGKTLLALIDGFPAGMDIDTAMINAELRLRQGGYGRGGRQKLETDEVEVLTGIWQGKSLGSPIALQVINRDYKLERLKELERPRPGHADLTGAIKYLGSIRGVLERSSARETAVRVAAGALARQLLRVFGIETLGYVVNLGGHAVKPPPAQSRNYEPNAIKAAFTHLTRIKIKRSKLISIKSAKRVIRSAASSKFASMVCHSAWEHTLNGIASSTVSWPKPSWQSKPSKG